MMSLLLAFFFIILIVDSSGIEPEPSLFHGEMRPSHYEPTIQYEIIIS